MTDGFLPYLVTSALASAVVGALVFVAAKRLMALRWYLNVPGAALATFAAFMFHGWVFTVTGVFARTMNSSFGGVPWESPATALVLTATWYMACRFFPLYLLYFVRPRKKN